MTSLIITGCSNSGPDKNPGDNDDNVTSSKTLSGTVYAPEDNNVASNNSNNFLTNLAHIINQKVIAAVLSGHTPLPNANIIVKYIEGDKLVTADVTGTTDEDGNYSLTVDDHKGCIIIVTNQISDTHTMRLSSVVLDDGQEKTTKDVDSATTIVAETLAKDKEALSTVDIQDVENYESNISQQINSGDIQLTQENLTTNTTNTILKDNFEDGLENEDLFTVTFTDSNLESIIRNSTEISGDLPTNGIYYTQAKEITTLTASNSGIQSLEGIQFLSNLTFLDIGSSSSGENSNDIGNIRYLSALTSLETLEADMIGIYDISGLSDLDNLKTIILSKNDIKDITPITGLNNLTELWLDDNRIEDISGLENVSISTALHIEENYLDLSEGSDDKQIIDQLIDQLGESNITYKDQKEIIDDPPTINLDQSNGDITGDTTATISGTVDDTEAQVTVEGEPVTLNEDGSFSIEVTLSEGDNTITIIATDKNGNEARKDILLTSDTTNPEVSVTNVTDGQSYDPPVTPEISTTDDTNTTNQVSLEKDGQEVADYSEGTEISAAGNYTLTITTTDEAGNTTKETITFSINDVAPPEISLNQSTTNIVNNNEFTVSGSVDEEATVYVDGNEVSVVDKQFSVTVSLTEGDNTIRVEAEDTSGNISTKDISATLDTVDPIVSISGVESGSSYNSSVTPIITNDEEGASYTWDISLTKDGNSVSGYSKGDEISEPGSYCLSVNATDAAGNQCNKTCLFTINADTESPIINLDQNSGERVNTASFTVSGTVNEEAVVTVNGTEVTLNSLAFTTDINLTEGENTITVTAEDTDGNTSTVQITVYLDLTAPVITVENVEDNGEYNSTIIPNITMNENGYLTVILKKDGSVVDYPEGSSISEPGNYVLDMEAVDYAGNTSTLQYSFTIYDAPVSLSISSSYDATNNNMVISLDEIVDLNNSNLTYSDLVNNMNMNLDNSILSLDDGINNTNLTINDINTSTEHVIDDTNDNIVINIPAIAQQIMDNQITFDPTNFNGDEYLILNLSGTNTLNWSLTRQIPFPDQVKVEILKYILDNYISNNNLLGELYIGTINDGDGGTANELLNNIGFYDYIGSEVNVEYEASNPSGAFDAYGYVDVTQGNQTVDVTYQISIGANTALGTTTAQIINQGIDTRITAFEDMMLNEDSNILNDIISTNGLNSNFNDLSSGAVDMSKTESITAIENDWSNSIFMTFDLSNSSIQYNLDVNPFEATFSCDYLIEIDKTPGDSNTNPDFISSGTATGKFIYESNQWNVRELIFTPDSNNEVVTFADSDLEAVIRTKINKPDGYIYKADLSNIIDLQAPNSNIDDLSGIENLVNLEVLNLGLEEVNGSWVNSNNITDLTPLANLTSLRELLLYKNSISDLSPLSNLTNLTRLSADFNNISSVTPLKNLTALTRLDLRDNALSDITDLSNLTNLTSLDLSINNISDISAIGNLVNLEWLALTNNSIVDISALSNLTNLTKLYIFVNQIEDVTPIANCTSLLQLDIGDNSISDISSLSTLTSLEGLYFESNPLTNIEVLRQLNNLDIVRMYNIDFATGSRDVIAELESEGVTVEYDTSNLNAYPAINISKTISDLTVTLNGDVTDNDGSVAEVTIDWGDGNSDVISSGFDSISLNHTYTENTNYTITITATDNENLSKVKEIPIDFNYTVITFADSDLENIIRNKISKPTGDIYKSDLTNITELDASNSSVADLTGIENLENLQTLYLGFIMENGEVINSNTINDLSPLSSLTSLTNLYLGSNQIDDLSPLTDLTNLTELELCHNQITDLSPLSNLTSLTKVYFWGNDIGDLTPLSNLTNLTSLNLSDNLISDLSPISTLTNLTDIRLDYNNLSNISTLSDLTNLTMLDLDGNQLTDLSALSSLTKLETLELRYNDITDVTPLADLVNLTSLYLANNNITDYTPLQPIYDQLENKDFVIDNTEVVFADPNLEQIIRDIIGKSSGTIYKNDVYQIESLDIADQNIGSISGIEALENLRFLNLGFKSDNGQAHTQENNSNTVSDLTPLQNLINLETLIMWGNKISDVTPLSNLTNLRNLHLNFNNVSDLTPLSNLTNLEYLEIMENQVSDISSLDTLTKLKFVHLDNNSIANISAISNWTQIEYLYLTNNQITDVTPMQNLTTLRELYLANNPIDDFSPLSGIYDQLEQKDFILNDEVISFPDPNLEQVIRDAINKQTGDIYKSDVFGIYNLSADAAGISSIEGLQYLENLESLYLTNDQISDLTPLANLTNLKDIGMWNNQISDISPLSGLTGLYYLCLNENSISDISVLDYSKFTNLETLKFGGNNVSDITSLTNLTDSIKNLELRDNSIMSVDPISNLTSLEILDLGNNGIVDINGLGNLTNLRELYLSENGVLDITPFENLTSLETLEIVNNSFSDLAPLSGLESLVYLNLKSNQITDVNPLSGLINLNSLYLSGNNITDYSPLEPIYDQLENKDFVIGTDEVVGFTDSNLEQFVRDKIGKQTGDIYESDVINITELYAYEQNITTLDGLEYFQSLSDLDLAFNSISDITPLTNLTQLNNLNLKGNNISDVNALSGLTNLNNLIIDYNSITSIDCLSQLTNLGLFSFNDNAISDISIVTNFNDLYEIDAHNNDISTLPDLTGLTNLDSLFIKGNPLSTTEYTNLSTLNSQLVNKDFILDEDLTDISAKINELFTAILNESKTDIEGVVYKNGIEVIGPNMYEHYQPNEFADMIAANYWEATEPQHATHLNLESNTINYPGVDVETYTEVDNVDPIFNNYYYEFKKDQGIWYFTKFEDKYTPIDTTNWITSPIDYDTQDQVSFNTKYPDIYDLTNYTDSDTGKMRYQIEDLSDPDVQDIKIQLRPDTDLVDSTLISTEAEFDNAATDGFNNPPSYINIIGYEKTAFDGFPAYKMLYTDSNGKGYGYLVFNSNNTLVYFFQYYKPLDQFANDLNLGKTLMDHISF